jgi:hypothetical protein
MFKLPSYYTSVGFFVQSETVDKLFDGGDDAPMFEPIRSLRYSRVDKIVRDLRRIYKENPTCFDIPAFARKIY